MAQKTKREATLLEALIPVFFTVIILMYTVLPIFGVNGEVHIPLILGALAAVIMAIWRLGYTWAEIEEGIISTISGTMQAIIILAIIGMIIGTWILGGIVPTLIYYGLQILSPGLFLVAACLLCCIVSLATGSSWTTAGTVGIALIGFGVLGAGFVGKELDAANINALLDLMRQNFNLNPLLLLVPVIVIIMVAKSTGSLVAATIFTCIITNVISGDQYLSLVLPGKMYKEEYHKRGLAPRNLSRCLEDAGTLTSPLVPWNTCGATMQTYLGVPTIEYLPYCFLNLINPIVSIIFGFTGITMLKLEDDPSAPEYREKRK